MHSGRRVHAQGQAVQPAGSGPGALAQQRRVVPLRHEAWLHAARQLAEPEVGREIEAAAWRRLWLAGHVPGEFVYFVVSVWNTCAHPPNNGVAADGGNEILVATSVRVRDDERAGRTAGRRARLEHGATRSRPTAGRRRLQ